VTDKVPEEKTAGGVGHAKSNYLAIKGGQGKACEFFSLEASNLMLYGNLVPKGRIPVLRLGGSSESNHFSFLRPVLKSYKKFNTEVYLGWSVFTLGSLLTKVPEPARQEEIVP